MAYVFDLEGNGLLDTVSVIHCGVFVHPETGDCKVFEPHQMQEMLAFMSQQKVLVGHNVLGYDFPALKKLYGFEFKGTIVDTLVMSRLLYPTRVVPPNVIREYREAGERIPGPHSVASWGYTLGISKVHHEEWSIYTPEMLDRCKFDVAIQVKLFKHLKDKMAEVKFPQAVMNRTFRVFRILNMMEQYGWLFDKERAVKSCSLLRHWMSRIERLIDPLLPMIIERAEVKKDGNVNWVRKPFLMSGKYSAITTRWYPELEGKGATDGFVAGQFSRIIIRKMDIHSRSEMVQYLLDSGWIPREWNYQTDDNGRVIKDIKGNPIPLSPKLNYKDPFDGVNGTAGQLIAKWVQCRHRLSLIEGLLGLVRPDGRISQRITGIAETGRLTHGGIVNIPGSRSFFGKRVRSLFTSKDGYKVVGTDSVSCQDRMLAARANDPDFTHMLLSGEKSKGTDGHSMNMHAINNMFKNKGLDYTVTRDTGKALGYAWKFGASDKKLAQTANVPPQYGEMIRDALASVSQAQAALVDKLTKEWESTAKVRMSDYGRPQMYGGTVRGLDGRPIRIELPHTILVYVLQSDEAICMQYALVILYDKLIAKGWKWGEDFAFVANVHDEYNCEVREELADEYAVLAAKAIEVAGRELGLSVDQQGESQIGDNWYEVH